MIETFFQQLLALFILLNILLSVPNALALLMGLARANRHYRLLHGLKIAAWVWRVFSVLLLFVLANFILDNWLHYQFDWLTHGLTGLAGVALLAYGIHDLVRFWKNNRRDFFSLIS